MAPGVSVDDLRAHLKKTYADEFFVKVQNSGVCVYVYLVCVICVCDACTPDSWEQCARSNCVLS